MLIPQTHETLTSFTQQSLTEKKRLLLMNIMIKS